MILTEYYLKKPITCQVTRLGDDLSLVIYGGHKSHLGAISIVEKDMEIMTHSFPGHKEQYITEVWAEKIAGKTGKRVCVQAGIHYDNATTEQIRDILAITDKMLQTILERL